MPDTIKYKVNISGKYQRNSVFPLFFLGFILMLFIPVVGSSQSTTLSEHPDTVYRYFPDHSPVKATWMSVALPGLGQYYNGQYWKIPIIYAGFSTLAFLIAQNKYDYNRFREAYAISMELPEGQESGNDLVNSYTSEQLLDQREYYQSNLELSYILTGVFYILQIVDASVDAHLYEYDIDEDLSIQIQPQYIPTNSGIRVIPGIGLRYKLSVE